MKNTPKVMVKNGMLGILFVMCFAKCETSTPTSVITDDIVSEPDTLYFTEEMRGSARVQLIFDSLTKDNLIPRNVWVPVHANGQNDLVEILNHSNLYLRSKDSNFQIKKNSNVSFDFYVNSDYEGYKSETMGECLTIYLGVELHENYVLSAYWIDSVFSCNEIVQLMMMYEPVAPEK
jgi:hypothetical protein